MEGGSSIGEPIHCKAAVLWAPGDKYKIENIVVAPPKKDQVRVKILYTSICHTDVTVGAIQALAPLFPVVLGHEASGIVESVGEGVTDIQAGDAVLPFMQGQCGNCSYCKSERINTCKEMPIVMVSHYLPKADVPHLTTEDGRAIGILMGLSTFSEYIVVHKTNLAKINPKAPLDKICVLSCGVGTGIGAVWKVAKVTPGSSVVVFGLGTVGLAVVQASKIAGASRIIGVDINPSKFEKGKELGLTDFINPKDHPDKKISTVVRELNGGEVDFSFECVGSPSVISEAIASTDVGVVVVMGISPSPLDEFQVNVYSLLRGKNINGTPRGGLRVGDFAGLVERYMNKEFQLEPYVTHNLPFSQINEAMEIFKSGDCLRCVLQMGV